MKAIFLKQYKDTIIDCVQTQAGQLSLIYHQNTTRGVAFSPIALRSMADTPQALGLLRLASGILLGIMTVFIYCKIK